MSSRRKPGRAGGAGKAQPPTFELTDKEASWTERYFRAMRQVDQSVVDEVTNMVVCGAELLVEQCPRHVRPALRLVGGASE